MATASEKNAREAILDGITTLAKIGTPGTCWISPNSPAQVVLTGKTESDILMIAGELGKGRIIAIAHNGYLDHFTGKETHPKSGVRQLQSNIKEWASRGKCTSDSDIIKLGGQVDKDKVKKAKLVYSNATPIKDQINVERHVLEYVKSGGGLVVASCPWGFLQLNPSKSLNDVPFAVVLAKVHVGFNGNYINCDGDGFDVASNKADVCDKSRSSVKKRSANSTSSSIAAILDNVSVIDLKGGIPGRLVVYGEKCEPVLTGDRPCDVIIAAGYLGNGRVVVMSHNGIMDKFQKGNSDNTDLIELQNNIKTWVSNGKYSGGPHGVCNLANMKAEQHKEKSVAGNHVVLFWSGGSWDPEVADSVLKKIRDDGCGCVIAMCPWGWLQLNGGKTLDDMPFNNLLKAVGVCFTDDYYGEKALCPSSNKADRGHCLQSLKRIAQNIDAADDDDLSAVEYLSFIPEEHRKTQISPVLYDCERACMNSIGSIIPTKDSPIKCAKRKGQLLLLDNVMKNSAGLNYKYPGAADFPGDIPGGVPPNYKCCISVEVESHTEDVHPTGYYVLPGETLTLQVINHAPDADFTPWQVMIGAHKDKLFNCSEIRRHPDIVVTKKVSDSELKLHTPFGGPVYLISPKNKRCTIQVWLINVIESPYYNINDPNSVADWPRRRGAPGLWADVGGEFVNFTIPSESVKNLMDPGPAIQTWDRVIRAHFHLKGTDLRKHRRQWVVSDRQPSCGYMHSGYPIVTHLDVTESTKDNFIMRGDHENLRGEGNWGLYHEIGHNMQDYNWTFEGTVEVTCNIFTLHAMEMVALKKIWLHHWVKNQVKDAEKYLKGGRVFSAWQSKPGVALFVYVQIAHNFGWDAFRKVFRSYPNSGDLGSMQEKINEFFGRMSEVVGRNLSPMLEFWGIPYSGDFLSEKSQGAPYLPDDEITRAVPEIVQLIMEKFPNVTRSAAKQHNSNSIPENLSQPVVQLPMVRIRGVSAMSN